MSKPVPKSRSKERYRAKPRPVYQSRTPTAAEIISRLEQRTDIYRRNEPGTTRASTARQPALSALTPSPPQTDLELTPSESRPKTAVELIARLNERMRLVREANTRRPSQQPIPSPEVPAVVAEAEPLKIKASEVSKSAIRPLQLGRYKVNFIEKEKGRCVVYVTSMGVVRDTHQRCHKVKQILKTLLVKFDERDCYMNREVQDEIRDRLPGDILDKMKKKVLDLEDDWETRKIGLLPACSYHGAQGQLAQPRVSNFTKYICLPQVFIEGQYLGDADVIEKLNETGELRKILKPYKALTGHHTCDGCGGFRMMPCLVCNGSKKSVHRNHFTEEFVALKCMHCDENGLVRCGGCNARK